MTPLARYAVWVSLALVGCFGETPDDEGYLVDPTEGSETGEESQGFVSPDDHGPLNECDSFMQSCPDGEKCVSYSSTGGNWDAFHCVAIMGDQAPGEPCTYGGVIEATDDCDATSACWNMHEVDGELVGTCNVFCTGTPDNPVCPMGTSCSSNGAGIPSYCVPTCDPVAQDCGPELGCYASADAFNCVVSSTNLPAGEPCGYINDCAPGLICMSSEVIPSCNGSACCTLYCDVGLGDAQCDAIPGTGCMPYFDGMAPSGYEHVGVCSVSP